MASVTYSYISTRMAVSHEWVVNNRRFTIGEKPNVIITNMWLLVNTVSKGNSSLPCDLMCHGWGVLSFVGGFPLRNVFKYYGFVLYL
jgi:hypothetical protein